jgi:hypothetical protein
VEVDSVAVVVVVDEEVEEVDGDEPGFSFKQM